MADDAKRTPISDWAKDDRPREKLVSKGKSSLSDAELVAILIGSGNTEESAVELARRILQQSQNNLVELSKMSLNELMHFKGIGEAKAISIIAALELGRRRRSAEALGKPAVKSSRDAFEALYSSVTDLDHEQFWVVMLDQANKVLRIERISEGGLTGTVADPKKIFKAALNSNACNIILCHNHPSGQLKPSDADIKLTSKLVKSGEMLDIKVLDHIIIGQDEYFSFADEGML
jgi:DNA repair protein RadC